MKRISVLTEDIMLFRKIKYELSGKFEVFMFDDPRVSADTVLVDSDNPRFATAIGLKMSRHGGDISLPFRIGDLLSLLNDEDGELKITEDGTVYIGTRAVRLTEVESALFSRLYEKGGDYVSRDELIAGVWGEGADEGVLNVYIHYLRAKLEANGERVITCTRGRGYKINEKYFGGRDA